MSARNHEAGEKLFDDIFSFKNHCPCPVSAAIERQLSKQNVHRLDVGSFCLLAFQNIDIFLRGKMIFSEELRHGKQQIVPNLLCFSVELVWMPRQNKTKHNEKTACTEP